jgi:replicative DNA helicase
MDVERALVSSAISAEHGMTELLSRGITPELFSGTQAGQQCAEVLRYCVEYTRAYQQQPSLSTIKRQYDAWINEFTTDPLSALADEFLDTVRKRYFEAKVLELSQVTKDRSSWGRLDEIMLDGARELASVIPNGRVGRFATDMQKRIEQYEIDANDGYRPGYLLGIPIIDEVTGGIRGGWLTTTAGFSGLGKTTLALLAGLNVFEADNSVLFCSLEMSTDEVMERLDTMVMNFPHRDLARRTLTNDYLKRWKGVSQVYGKAAAELTVVDKLGGCTLDRVHAEITRYKPKVAIIDYVQRMSGTRNSMSKWEGLEEITNGLKTIAMDTDTSIIMVSQDGRTSADEGSTRSNMGGSVSVYQAADVYLGLQQTDEMAAMGKMRVKMLKNRHGPRAEVDMSWKPAIGEFGKWDDPMAYMK